MARRTWHSRLLTLRALVAAIAAVLVFQAAYAAPVAAASAPARAIGPVVPHAAPPVDDTPVLDPADEVVTARTESSRTYDLGDGRYAVEAFADPLFYQPLGSTDWLPIELDFATIDNGASAAVTRAPVQVTVGPSADGLVALEHDGHRIALRPIPVTPADPGAADLLEATAPAAGSAGAELPADAGPVRLAEADVRAALDAPATAGRPVPERQRVDLPDVLPGVGLRVFAHPYGTTNFLVLAGRPATPSWTFAVKAKGLTLIPGQDGALEFVDDAGKRFATMPAPYAVDSTPDEATGSGRTTTAAWYTLSALGGQQLVTVSVDPAWLADAVYPVYVDPSITIYNEGTSSNGDTHVNAGNPDFNYANYQRPDSPYAYEMWLGESPSDPTYFNMAYIQFDLGAYTGTLVDDASLEVRPYHQYYNAPTTSRTWLRRVTEAWTESITWNTKPTKTDGGMTWADCVEGAQCAFDVTTFAANWLDGDWLDAGVRLDEIDTSGTWKGPTYWKRLIASEQGTSTRPRLILTYHNPVSVTSPDGGATARTAGRTLSWATEQGWGQDAYRVDVSTSSTFATTLVTSGDVTGTAREWAIPTTTALTSGTTYYWRVKARRTTTRVPATTMWSQYASGSFTHDPGANLGMGVQHSFESFDLGAGDSLAVNVATGNLVLAHPLVALPIRGSSISVDLAYNSFDTANVGMGPGWRLNMHRRLAQNADGTVTLTAADGSRHTFTAPVTAGTVTTYTRPATLYATLVKDTSVSANEFTLTWRDQSRDRFDIAGSEGLLVREEDRFANGVTLAYAAGTSRISTITDTAAGRTITLGYDASNRLASITDWAVVSGGVVQAGGTGNRVNRFVYDASGRLAGWADPLNTSGSCPTAGSHLTCLTYAAGTAALVSAVSRTQTVEGAGATALTTTTRIITTEIAYRGDEVASVTDAEQQAAATPARTVLSRPAAAQVLVVRPGTPASQTKYGLAATTDPYARVTSVKRLLGASTWIEQRTAYDATYPVEPASVTENFTGTGTPSDAAPDANRVTTYAYVANSMGLVSRMTEPLTASTHRTTDSTYNANNDVTQTITALDGSASVRTVTRSCYDASCTTTGTGLVLLWTISNYADGTAGNGAANVEDVTTTYQADAWGQRTRETRANYTAAGTLLDAAATGWTYDDRGNQTAEIRNYANGTVTNPGDDITPNATTGARTDLTTTFGHDTAGNRTSTADPRRAIEAAKGTTLGADDFTSRATFDALGQQLSERTPTTPGVSITQKTATTAYDELGNVREAVDFGGLVTGTEFDRAARADITYEDTASGNPDITSDATLDAAGRVTSAKDRRQVDDASLGATVTAYDELGRPTSVTGAWTSPLTPLATITTTAYDALDRVLLEETGVGDSYATGQRTAYTYDLGGRSLSADDEFACNKQIYDWRGLATSETSGLEGETCAVVGGSRTVEKSYDALGQLLSSEVTAGTGDGDILAAATYDSAGRLLSSYATTAGTTVSSGFIYNPLDETVAETRSVAGVPTTWSKSTYDAAGNPADRCTWNIDPGTAACLPVGQAISPAPAVRSTATYDARSNRLSLADGTTSTTTVYDPEHNYLPKAFYVPTASGRELQTLYEYDSRHRIDDPATPGTPGIIHQLCVVSSGHACSSTTTLGSDEYLHDDTDNRTKVVEANGATSSDRRYCYDGLNRLRARNTGSGCTLTSGDETYTFDDAGNRLTAPGATASYDAQGQLATCTGCGTVSHDSAGRLTALAGWTYGYDAEGRLLAATETASGDHQAMTYDAGGHRTKIVTTEVAPNPDIVTTREFRYQGDAIVEEKVTDLAHPAGAVVRTYTVTEAGQVVSMTIPAGETGAGTYLPTWNGHGDALALWKRNDNDGTLILANSYTYATWGIPTTEPHNGIPDLGFRFLYVGASDVQWDNFSGTELLYMHARHYSPRIGRFLQPDPIAAEANPYAYAANSPITRTDACGLWSLLDTLICLELRKDIKEARDELARRWDQLREDDGRMSLGGRVWNRTRAGEENAYRNRRKSLINLLEKFDDRNCGGKPPFSGGIKLPDGAREYASRAVPKARPIIVRFRPRVTQKSWPGLRFRIPAPFWMYLLFPFDSKCLAPGSCRGGPTVG